MKPALKLTSQIIAALTFAAAPAQPTPAQQGGPVVQDRRERQQQREATRRFEDFQRRQFALKMLGKQVGRPDEPTEPQMALAQIKEDFWRLQVVDREMSPMALPGVALDAKFVANSATEIRKRAGRLKFNLMLPEAEKGNKLAAWEVVADAEQLKPSLAVLSEMIVRFVNNPMFQSANTVGADLGAKAQRDLEDIIELSDRIKRSSKKLNKGKDDE